MKLTDGLPNRVPAWALFGRESIRIARERGLQVDGEGAEDGLTLWYLTDTEAQQDITFEGVAPQLVIRCPMALFADSKSDGWLLWCSYDASGFAGKDPRIVIGNKKYSIQQFSMANKEELVSPAFIELHPPMPAVPGKRVDVSSCKARSWTRGEGGSRTAPGIAPLPTFQLDVLESGVWQGSVALFATPSDADRAALSSK
jgi:hypothetical protein